MTRLDYFVIGALLGWLLVSIDAHAAEPVERWAVMPLASWHANRDIDHNEVNPGIGIEHSLPWEDWRGVVGTYRNSYYRQTVYAGGVYEMWNIGAGWRANVAAVAVIGYTGNRVELAVMPGLVWEGKKFGVSLTPFAPSVIALQVKMRY